MIHLYCFNIIRSTTNTPDSFFLLTQMAIPLGIVISAIVSVCPHVEFKQQTDTHQRVGLMSACPHFTTFEHEWMHANITYDPYQETIQFMKWIGSAVNGLSRLFVDEFDPNNKLELVIANQTITHGLFVGLVFGVILFTCGVIDDMYVVFFCN